MNGILRGMSAGGVVALAVGAWLAGGDSASAQGRLPPHQKGNPHATKQPHTGKGSTTNPNPGGTTLRPFQGPLTTRPVLPTNPSPFRPAPVGTATTGTPFSTLSGQGNPFNTNPFNTVAAAAANPFANPFANPYGTSSFSNPYGTSPFSNAMYNPYRINPYNTGPFASPYNQGPFSNPYFLGPNANPMSSSPFLSPYNSPYGVGPFTNPFGLTPSPYNTAAYPPGVPFGVNPWQYANPGFFPQQGFPGFYPSPFNPYAINAMPGVMGPGGQFFNGMLGGMGGSSFGGGMTAPNPFGPAQPGNLGFGVRAGF